MKRKALMVLSALCVLVISGGFRAAGVEQESAQPAVEVVFALDTTGSMGGLIEGAKQKIWSIANEILKGKPTPQVRIGLVGYRDYGDEYITKVFPLSEDLDSVYENLMSFRAEGGGDTPEHVNRALHDAVYEMKWSQSRSTLKIVFLVGDCPPHMDYSDGFDYRKICQKAALREIIINTVQCGDYADTVPYWKDIARRAEGSYAAVAQSGGMTSIETPYDDELARLNGMLEETVVAFGSAVDIAKSEERSAKVKKMAPLAAAERAAYKSAEGDMSPYDLIGALENGEAALKDIKDENLPREMRGMGLKEKEEYLRKKKDEREALRKEIEELSKKRSAYIGKKLKESSRRDSFDGVVQDIIQKQAAAKGIAY